jgi:prevent-host-death family protein
MKTVAASDVRDDLEGVLGSAQNERIVVTRKGKPSAVLIGIESYDDEDSQLTTSEDFWRLIEERRKGRSISLAELRSRLNLKKSSRAKASKTKAPTKREGQHSKSRGK